MITFDAMTCISAIEDNFSVLTFHVPIVSISTSNLVVSLSNCASMTSTIDVFLFETRDDDVLLDDAY